MKSGDVGDLCRGEGLTLASERESCGQVGNFAVGFLGGGAVSSD